VAFKWVHNQICFQDDVKHELRVVRFSISNSHVKVSCQSLIKFTKNNSKKKGKLRCFYVKEEDAIAML